MLTNEDRKQILISFLETVETISDQEFQKRIWIRGEGPEVTSFDDAVCDFFIESEGIIDEYKDFGLSETQKKSLTIFRSNFESFIDHPERPYLPEEFIDTPEWDAITKEAKQLLKAFDYKKPQ